ncbi:hypothetical protein EGW08_020017 [Elysia chlorotica]|uniref:Uncharacterized protein n=1 Tax=Elysia chlorotica TaxID=188477 RepID=A0A433SSL8_ELYCH|nr:hypothetical protein EGW08_020017 [Elysia chlorotica]
MVLKLDAGGMVRAKDGREGDSWRWRTTSGQLRYTGGRQLEVENNQWSAQIHGRETAGGGEQPVVSSDTREGDSWRWRTTSGQLRYTGGRHLDVENNQWSAQIHGRETAGGGEQPVVSSDTREGDSWRWRTTSGQLRYTGGRQLEVENNQWSAQIHGRETAGGGEQPVVSSDTREGDSWRWRTTSGQLRYTGGRHLDVENNQWSAQIHGRETAGGGEQPVVSSDTREGDSWRWRTTSGQLRYTGGRQLEVENNQWSAQIHGRETAGGGEQPVVSSDTREGDSWRWRTTSGQLRYTGGRHLEVENNQWSAQIHGRERETPGGGEQPVVSSDTREGEGDTWRWRTTSGQLRYTGGRGRHLEVENNQWSAQIHGRERETPGGGEQPVVSSDTREGDTWRWRTTSGQLRYTGGRHLEVENNQWSAQIHGRETPGGGEQPVVSSDTREGDTWRWRTTSGQLRYTGGRHLEVENNQWSAQIHGRERETPGRGEQPVVSSDTREGDTWTWRTTSGQLRYTGGRHLEVENNQWSAQIHGRERRHLEVENNQWSAQIHGRERTWRWRTTSGQLRYTGGRETPGGGEQPVVSSDTREGDTWRWRTTSGQLRYTGGRGRHLEVENNQWSAQIHGRETPGGGEQPVVSSDTREGDTWRWRTTSGQLRYTGGRGRHLEVENNQWSAQIHGRERETPGGGEQPVVSSDTREGEEGEEAEGRRRRRTDLVTTGGGEQPVVSSDTREGEGDTWRWRTTSGQLRYTGGRHLEVENNQWSAQIHGREKKTPGGGEQPVVSSDTREGEETPGGGEQPVVSSDTRKKEEDTWRWRTTSGQLRYTGGRHLEVENNQWSAQIHGRERETPGGGEQPVVSSDTREGEGDTWRWRTTSGQLRYTGGRGRHLEVENNQWSAQIHGRERETPGGGEQPVVSSDTREGEGDTWRWRTTSGQLRYTGGRHLEVENNQWSAQIHGRERETPGGGEQPVVSSDTREGEGDTWTWRIKGWKLGKAKRMWRGRRMKEKREGGSQKSRRWRWSGGEEGVKYWF